MANTPEWFVVVSGASQGPMILADLVARLPSAGGMNAMVFGPGLSEWTPAGRVGAVATAAGQAGARPTSAPPPLPMQTPMQFAPQTADPVSYRILGQEIQYVEMDLTPGQMVIGEPGFMMYMTNGVKMDTVFGDPSATQPQGFFDKLKTASKRALTGESMFISTFTAAAGHNETVCFAAPHPGKIIALDLAQHGGQIICQKDCFLCAARGVHINIAFQKKIMTGLFGGEGLIMQRLDGAGMAMIAVGGMLMERELAPGETLKMESGCLVALQSSVTYDVQWVGGIKNAVFGGEGLFFATVTGPGKVWVQSMPFSRLASRVLAHFHPTGTSNSASDGSLLSTGVGLLLGRND